MSQRAGLESASQQAHEGAEPGSTAAIAARGFPPSLQHAASTLGAGTVQRKLARRRALRSEVAAVQPSDPEKDGDDQTKQTPKPDLTGIGSSIAIGRFVTEAKNVQAKWDQLKPGERADDLGKAANVELKNAGVPEVGNKLEDLGTTAGQFHYKDWTLGLGQKPFSRASVSDVEAADMADTVYHEARHAEQWHRMARYLAGKGKKTNQIAKEMGVPSTVAATAVAKPIHAGKPEGTEGQSFYDSIYGKDATHRTHVLTTLRAKAQAWRKADEDYQRLADDLRAAPAEVQKAKENLDNALAEFQAAHKDYSALPEEADAWAIGAATTSAYLKK